MSIDLPNGIDTQLYVAELETDLKQFRPALRERALRELVRLQAEGAIPLAPPSDLVNLHCHTFFSFNAYGHSPSSLAWLARAKGYRLMGIVDFDVLDAVDEFLAACDLAGVRGTAGIETRVFIPEFADREVNSPGEPGVAYHMGIGFPSGRVPAPAAPILADLRRRAAERNRAVVARVNAYLDPLAVDYEADVVPLTPAGNPTERHIVAAYLNAAARRWSEEAGRVAFWAARLALPPEQVTATMADSAKFQNLIRARLMKQGGPGYVRPESGAFPGLESFHELITACGALPCFAWLDGTSAGEQAIGELLDLAVRRGVVAANIIPDRNWNIADPATRRLKVENLYRFVQAARDLDLPLNVGTEMNSFGQKLVDDLDGPELAPVRQDFLDGAHFVYGHTVLQRALGLGYQSAWARAHLPTRRQRNDFYTAAGRLVPPGADSLSQLGRLSPALSPADLLAQLPGQNS